MNSMGELKADSEALQNTAHVVQTCRAAYSQTLETLDVQEEVCQERKLLEIAQNVERKQRCQLADLENMTALQEKVHEKTRRVAEVKLLTNLQVPEREDRLFRMDKGMQEEQERWRAEKAMKRTAQEEIGRAHV